MVEVAQENKTKKPGNEFIEVENKFCDRFQSYC